MTAAAVCLLNPEQLKLARHALGLDSGGRKQSYRNRYLVAPGTATHGMWLDMVRRGWAFMGPSLREDGKPQYAGGADIFGLSYRGASMALHPGESLDPEDFELDSAEA
jgi:hypothetical protein